MIGVTDVIEVDFSDGDFLVEVIDESAGEVLIFEDADLLAQYEAAEERGAIFDDPRIRRRVLELRDQLLAITGELDFLLETAA